MKVLCSGSQEADEVVSGDAVQLEWEGLCGAHSACWQIPASWQVLATGPPPQAIHNVCLLSSKLAVQGFQPSFKGVT